MQYKKVFGWLLPSKCNKRREGICLHGLICRKSDVFIILFYFFTFKKCDFFLQLHRFSPRKKNVDNLVSCFELNIFSFARRLAMMWSHKQCFGALSTFRCVSSCPQGSNERFFFKMRRILKWRIRKCQLANGGTGAGTAHTFLWSCFVFKANCKLFQEFFNKTWSLLKRILLLDTYYSF